MFLELIPSPSSWSVVDNLKAIISKMFDIMSTPITAGGVSFTLLDVWFAGGLLILAGAVIVELFIWTKNRR